MADKPGSHDQNSASDADRNFSEDISRIANGAKQINHAAFSATRGEQREASASAQRSENKTSSMDALTRMAAWDAQRVVIAGVEMTNAEAQAARLRVIENGDMRRGRSSAAISVPGRKKSSRMRPSACTN